MSEGFYVNEINTSSKRPKPPQGSLGKDNFVLLSLLEEIIEYLKHNEWQTPIYDENNNLYCSECSYTKAAGHDENCKIDKFLTKYYEIISK